jgi:hypothetical protein
MSHPEAPTSTKGNVIDGIEALGHALYISLQVLRFTLRGASGLDREEYMHTVVRSLLLLVGRRRAICLGSTTSSSGHGEGQCPVCKRRAAIHDRHFNVSRKCNQTSVSFFPHVSHAYKFYNRVARPSVGVRELRGEAERADKPFMDEK